MINQDGIIFGLLALCVAVVVGLSHSSHPSIKRFFAIFPSVLLVYLIPSLLTTFGVIDVTNSNLYQFNIDYLLPACLILLTLSLDLPALGKLGPKCLLVFLSGTFGVVVGGPLALGLVKAVSPEAIHPDTWKVMATLAGSWIGGGVNQATMKETFQVPEDIFVSSVAVDILVGAFFWLSTLFFLANKNEAINKWLKADQSLLDQLDVSGSEMKEEVASFSDFCWMVALGFGGTALGRFVATPIVDLIKDRAPYLEAYNLTSTFFWVIIVTSIIGVLVSLTPFRKLEAKGASKMGSVMLYLLIASIGMKIDLANIWSSPVFFVIGMIWILIHGIIILTVTKLLKAPLFFMAVGSQANIGAAASAPLVASAFSPHLAPVGVILSILGYVLGNYAAYICGILMRWVQY